MTNDNNNPGNKDKKPGIIKVTDPREVEDILGKQHTHEALLEEDGRRKRMDRLEKKFAKKAESGKLFNIVWHKIESVVDAQSTLLRGRITHSRDKDGEYFTLSVEADYGKLYALNPDKQDILADKKSTTREFNQQRATSFSAGSYDSHSRAVGRMHEIDQYLMHVLAEQGAEKTMLEVLSGGIALKDDAANAADQSYSDALRTARLVQVFREALIDKAYPDFRHTVGTFIPVLADDIGIDYERQEGEQNGRTLVSFIFDDDIGRFHITDNGNQPPQLIHEVKNSGGGYKRRFDDSLSSGVLQEQFINWVASAARERGLIADEDFESFHGEMQNVRGISLRRSQLGLLSPFSDDLGSTGYRGTAPPGLN